MRGQSENEAVLAGMWVLCGETTGGGRDNEFGRMFWAGLGVTFILHQGAVALQGQLWIRKEDEEPRVLES